MNDLLFYYLVNLANVLDDLGAGVANAIQEKNPRPFCPDHILARHPVSPAVGNDNRNGFGTNHSDKQTV